MNNKEEYIKQIIELLENCNELYIFEFVLTLLRKTV